LNKDIYKDEFGQYHEVDEEVETPIDGLEDDEQDPSEVVDDLDDLFDLAEDDNEYDEDEAYANERCTEYDTEED
jgi:hypothetical protein